MADLVIHRPLSDTTVTVPAIGRILIAEGKVFAYPAAVGVGGHLVKAGTHEIVATGTIISYRRSGAEMWWSLLFDVTDTFRVPDGRYDVIVTTYRNDLARASEGLFDEVLTVHDVNLVSDCNVGGSAQATIKAGVFSPERITISPPSPPVHKESFTATGQFTNGDKPTTVKMSKTGETPRTVTPYCAPGSEGYWYGVFIDLTAGTYTLDSFNATVSAPAVTMLVVV